MSFLYSIPKTAHRDSQGRVWISTSFSPWLSHRHPSQLALQTVIDSFMNGQDCVKQRPVSRGAVQRPHGGRQGFDETFVLQLGNILSHRVRTHAGALSDFPKARVAQVGFPVLTKQQVSVHGDLTCTQSQGEDLIRQKEIMS